MEEKINKLFTILDSMPNAVVAFSGGTDSALLAAAAFRRLRDKSVAVTAYSPTLAMSEQEDAAAGDRRHRVHGGRRQRRLRQFLPAAPVKAQYRGGERASDHAAEPVDGAERGGGGVGARRGQWRRRRP